MNRVEKVIEKFKPVFGGSIPQLSAELGIHRSTLHHAKRRGTFSSNLQSAFMRLAKETGVKLEASEVINA